MNTKQKNCKVSINYLPIRNLLKKILAARASLIILRTIYLMRKLCSLTKMYSNMKLNKLFVSIYHICIQVY